MIADAARALLDAVRLGEGVRLLGVSVSQLGAPGAVQGRLDLDDPVPATSPERAALERTVDAVRARFGEDAVGRAASVEHGRVRTGRRGSLWGPDPEGA